MRIEIKRIDCGGVIDRPVISTEYKPQEFIWQFCKRVGGEMNALPLEEKRVSDLLWDDGTTFVCAMIYEKNIINRIEDKMKTVGSIIQDPAKPILLSTITPLLSPSAWHHYRGNACGWTTEREICAICLQKLDFSKIKNLHDGADTSEWPIVLSKCHHVFHGSCIARSCEIKKECPACRERTNIKKVVYKFNTITFVEGF